MNKAKFKLIKGDLLGNDIDGYDWNDSFDIGTYTIEDYENKFNAKSREVLQKLVEDGIFNECALEADNIDIEWNWDEENGKEINFLYIDLTFNKFAPRSLERYELRQVNA